MTPSSHDPALHRLIRQALVYKGDLLPTTADEVRLAESNPEFWEHLKTVELPESLRDPNKIWEKIQERQVR